LLSQCYFPTFTFTDLPKPIHYPIDIENAVIVGVDGLKDGTYLHAKAFLLQRSAPFNVEVAH
jgi:hypothetical protein